MHQGIPRIEAVTLVGPHSLELRFNDGAIRRVNLLTELVGEVFEPLRDPGEFARVVLDPVAGTVVWPNGADFAPDFLRELPEEARTRTRQRSPNLGLQRTAPSAATRHPATGWDRKRSGCPPACAAGPWAR